MLFYCYQSYHWYQWRPFLSPLTPMESICEYWTTLVPFSVPKLIADSIKSLSNATKWRNCVCVCFVCLFLCEIVDKFDFRRSRGRSAGSFPEQRLYCWPPFAVTFHAVGSGSARWETLVIFHRWVIDGYASKHNNHDRLYCGNLRFWAPCVDEDQAWSRVG